MRIQRVFLMMVMFALLLSMPVSAELIVNKYTNDFTLSSANNEQIKLCSCETKVDTIIVENTGIFHGGFTVDIVSDYPGTIRVAESGFNLEPTHFKEIPIYIEDSCGLSGTYIYEITVRNSYGRVERLTRTINAQQCQTAQFTVTPEGIASGLCEPAVFETTITNVGPYPDTFSLDFAGYNEVVSADQLAVHLQPDESFTQDVSVAFDCKEYGTFVVPFILHTDTQGVAAVEERTVTVENEFDFSLNVPTDMAACAQTETTVPFELDNTINVENTVTLELDAPGFVSLSAEEYSLAGYESADMEFIIAPEAHHVGEFQVRVIATDAHGGIQKVRESALDIERCYEPAVELRLSEADVAPDTLTTCCGQETYYVNLENRGTKEQTFVLSLDGPSYFVLDETTVRVQPSQNINVPIRADLPCTDEQYDVTVSVSPEGQSHIIAEDTFSVTSLTQRTCHMVQIDDDELSFRETEDILPVIVQHTGIRGGNYSLEIESPIFLILEESIMLSPGERKPIHLVPIVNLTEQAKGRYISEPTLTLQEQNLEYNEHIGVELKGRSLWQQLKDWWCGLPWESVTACIWMIVLLLALLILLVILLLLIYTGRITIFREGIAKEFLFLIKTILIVLLILLVLGFLILTPPGAEQTHQRLADNSDATVLEWYQNERFSIDLDQYFDDPDSDTLKYTASQPRDIGARIDGGILTLIPDHNFAGENMLVVTASDQKGGVTDSPIFLLRVIPQKNLGFLGWLNLWCSYWKLLLIVLIVLVLLLGVLTIRERRTGKDRTSKNVLVVVPKSAQKRKVKRSRTAKAPKKRRLTRFYSSKKGTKAHRAGCMALNRVKKNERKVYKSERAVLKDGLALCSICYEAPSKNPTARMKKRKSSKADSSKKSVKKASTDKAAKKASRKAGKGSRKKAKRKATAKRESKKASKKSKKKSRKRSKRKSKKRTTSKASKKTAKKAGKKSSVKKTAKKSKSRRKRSAKNASKKDAPKKVSAVPVKADQKQPAKKDGKKSEKDEKSQTVNIQLNIKQ